MGAGAAAGSFLGPAGAIVGGIVGGLAGGMGTNVAQEAALKATGFDDSEQRAANVEENKWSSFAGGMLPAVAGMSVSAGASRLAPMANELIQRGAGAAFGGAMEAGQEYLNEGNIDPAKAAVAAAVGAVFPGVNRVGAKFVGAGERFVPGRPNRTANPAADQAHADVDDAVAEVDITSSSLAQPAPRAVGDTTGNPQSAPQRSARVYSKGVDPAMQGRYAEALADPEVMRELAFEEGVPESQMREIAKANYQPGIMTQGDHDPATIAAAKLANPAPAGEAPIPGFDDHPSGVGQAAPARPPIRSEEGLINGSQLQREAVNKVRQKLAAQNEGKAFEPEGELTLNPDRPAAPQVVDTGFPQEGQPLAVGANEATPMPAKAAKAVARSKGEVPKEMPALKGEAPINDSVTEAQKAAGNYPKARTHDFGKPAAVETHAGDVRRGTSPRGEAWEVKLPYDYGYYNKTKGADKDHIDFARPLPDAPEKGDRHFIIDQLHSDTGKFDEHKVFNYYKDPESARAHYEAGFSDGKGAQRLGAITEVTRPELVKWLQRHTSTPATKPYGKIAETAKQPAKPVAERAVVQDLVSKLKAAGKDAEAAKVLATPEDQLAKAIEGKRVRKYGVGTGASAGYPVEGITTADGRPVTANTKAKAAERSAAHKAMVDQFESRAPKGEETNGQLLSRVTGAKVSEGWVPSHKPREWLWAREAAKLVKKPTPAAIGKFREAERLLRGDEAAVENYRSGNRIEADIGRSRRTGDEAVAGAESKLAATHNVEDEMIAAIDAKRAPKKEDYWEGLAKRTAERTGMSKADQRKLFDTPHEEAETMVTPKPVKSKADLKELPRKTVDVKDSSLAKIDTKAISKVEMSKAEARKAEAATLAGKKSAKANVESEGAATPVRQIKINDPAEQQRLLDLLSKATTKKGAEVDALPPEREPPMPKAAQDLFDRFIADEKGSMDINAVKQAWNNFMEKTEPKSYRAMSLKTPREEYAQSLSDTLHKANNEDKRHWIGVLQKIKAMPKELNNEAALAKIYHARDADSANFPLPGKQPGKTNIESLDPALKALYDEHLKPLLDENDQFVANIRAIDPDRIGPDVVNHVSRITKGETPDYNMLKWADDPTAPPQFHGMSVSANAAKTRKFYALEDQATGRRYVIQPTDTGFAKWDRYKRENIKAGNFEFEDGATFEAGPNKYTMRQATTQEIMDNARGADGGKKPMKYYTNAGLSAAVANAQLASMARHLGELARITESPEFRKYSTRNRAKAEERGWEESNLPNMRGIYLDPNLKGVFDDFAGHKQGTYRQLNSAVTKMLFWMPTAHINNVAAHWFIGRGWDNLSVPKNVRMVFQDMPRAIQSVVNQDAYQKQMLREGAGLIYPSVLTRGMLEKIAKGFQVEIERAPGKWGPIADKFGMGLKAFGNAIYDTSAKVMWSANDVFLTQRVMELERKGIPMAKAIVEAERDIPNYRLPHVIGGRGEKGRMFSRFMGDPALTSFGRYHYGMWNSYANIVKDAIGKDAKPGDRADAVGKLMTLGVLSLVIYPMMYDKFAQLVTGDEDAKAARRGPAHVPALMAQAATGEQDVAAFARASLTVPPVVSWALGALSNKDFRGKSIVEPADVKGAFQGDARAAGRAGVQLTESIARGLVSPYSTLANATRKQAPDETAGGAALRAVRDAALDIKDPSEKAKRYQRMLPATTSRASISRFKQGGAGPAEALFNKATGYK